MVGELLTFKGHAFNITAPFVFNGNTYIAGRLDGGSYFFEEQGGVWYPVPPMFDLQDPFVTIINGELIFGGVRDYRTEFYRGVPLTKFAEGPPRMKDIRLLGMPSGEVAVFTRPHVENGKGRIGFMMIPSLDALNTSNLLEAEIIKGQFRDDEWGGANELHLLKDGRIGVLGHIACISNGEKHYAAMVFIYPYPLLWVIATRKDFPVSLSKCSPQLDDVVFPGGLIRHRNGTATLYAGLSDAAAGRITIPDPFFSD